MKKLILLLCVALLPQFSFYLFADGDNEKVDFPIPLHKPTDVKHERSIDSIEAFYNVANNAICIYTSIYMGEICIVVTNLLNGNTYNSWFDSSATSGAFVQIDGMAGIYELVLTSEYGDVFIGNFILE